MFAPLSRALLVGLVATKVYSAAGADIVMESIKLGSWRNIAITLIIAISQRAPPNPRLTSTALAPTLKSSQMSGTTKILVIGSGGREHALVWKLRQSPRAGQIYLRPRQWRHRR